MGVRRFHGVRILRGYETQMRRSRERVPLRVSLGPPLAGGRSRRFAPALAFCYNEAARRRCYVITEAFIRSGKKRFQYEATQLRFTTHRLPRARKAAQRCFT